MQTLFQNGRLLWPDGRIAPGELLLEGGAIAQVAESITRLPGVELVDARGLTIAPAFIDLHVHGGGGFSLATRDAEEIRSYARWAASRGVGSFLASICAGSLDEAIGFVQAAAAAAGPVAGGATVLGLHLEGPFVSPARAGALPPTWLMPPGNAAFRRILTAANGQLRVMTLAPELPGSEQVLQTALSEGIVVAVGHTDAGYEGALPAFRAGASHVTHAFNAMHPWHHRDPGPLGAALVSDGVTLEVIADGVHLHPATVAMLFRAFGPERVALVTDAVTPAGLKAGAFRIGSQEARLERGRMLLPDGTIAGSAATMDELVRNVVSWGCASTPAALRMASLVPARVLGLARRKGEISPKFAADLVLLDDDLHVAATWIAGQQTFQR